MAICTSSNLTLPNTTANPAISAATKLPTAALSFRHQSSRRLSVTAAASTSTSKPHTHHHNILEMLHLKQHPSTAAAAATSVEEEVQTLNVYEFNEGDRRSPAFLKLSKVPEKSLGDIVTFTNKLYSGDLAARLGITAGMIMYIEDDAEGGGDRYEAVYSFHFGKYGHVSIQGPYFSNADSELAVTGGTGVFEGARGKVRLTNVAYPYKLFYTLEIEGIKGRLPRELLGGPAVDPNTLKPAKEAH